MYRNKTATDSLGALRRILRTYVEVVLRFTIEKSIYEIKLLLYSIVPLYLLAEIDLRSLISGGAMASWFSTLVFGSSGPGSSPGRGHCVVFLGKTLYSYSTCLRPGVQMGTGELYGNPAMA